MPASISLPHFIQLTKLITPFNRTDGWIVIVRQPQPIIKPQTEACVEGLRSRFIRQQGEKTDIDHTRSHQVVTGENHLQDSHFLEIRSKRAGSRLSDLKYKLMTIELLNLAKNYYTYRELARIMGLPETVLSRYVKGHVLPTFDRAQNINLTLHKIMRFEGEIQERIRFDDDGYFDNTHLLSDTLLLERGVQHAINVFAGMRITKVLTAANDGIPLAALLAHRLGVSLIIAKKTREVGVREFFEEVYIPRKTAIMISLFVPRDAFRKGDCVLIVDDVIDSGDTQIALVKIAQRAKSEVTGIYALVGMGSDWKSRIEAVTHCPVEIVLKIGAKPIQEARFDRSIS